MANNNPYDPEPVVPQTGMSFQDTNLFIDPVTSAQFESDLRSGNTSGVASAFFQSGANRDVEIAKRSDVLRQGVEAAGGAALATGTQAAERAIQKQGKLRSSALVYGEGGLLDVSEAAKLQSEAQMSQGLLNIYSQVGQEQAQRESLGAQIYQTGAQIGSQERITGIQTSAQQRIAEINTASAERIAQVQADTELTGFQKQIEIANINATAAKDVADINRKSHLEGIKEQNIGAITLQAAGFDFYTNDGVKNWVKSQEFQDMDIKERARQFDASIAESIRTFDASRTDQANQFQKNIDYMYDALDIEEDKNEWQKKLAFDSFYEQSRQFDLTNNAQVNQFAMNLAWAKESFNLSQTQTAEIARAALLEQSEQFDTATNLEYNKWWVQFGESAEQFDLTFTQSRDIQNAALKIQQEKHATDQLGAAIDVQLQVLGNPEVVAYLDEMSKTVKGAEKVGQFTDDIMSGIFSDMLATGRDWTPEETEERVNTLVGDITGTGGLNLSTYKLPSGKDLKKGLQWSEYNALPPDIQKEWRDRFPDQVNPITGAVTTNRWMDYMRGKKNG